VTEFLVAMKGDLNERRKKFVKMAFDVLDTDGSGAITVDEIAAVYDVTCQPDVQSGRKTKQQALQEFMSHWRQRKDETGAITLEDFLDYYKEVSASIDGDDYFELMIRNAWRIAGGTGNAANTANRRVLVTKADGKQSVETINNELGLKAQDIDGMKSRLARQGINASDIQTFGGVDNTDKRGQKPRPPTPPARRHQEKENSIPSPRQGDFSMPPPPPANTSKSSKQSENDPFDIMKRLLYSPPVSLEQLGIKLQISVASSCPRVPSGAFISRFAIIER